MQAMAVQQHLSLSINTAAGAVTGSRHSSSPTARAGLPHGKFRGHFCLEESSQLAVRRSPFVSSFLGLKISTSQRKGNHPSWRVQSRKVAVNCSANGTAGSKPLRVMISGAPASGKGTQCEQIVERYGLTHISAGDLLRAEVAAGTEYGKKAKAYMDAGDLVPDDVVVTMVKARLAQRDAQEKGWLLDGYPRSASQAAALESGGIRPDIFVVLEVPDEILVDRVVGRRQDPVTGKIYHLKYSPPESAEIAARLTQRSDDTEEKVKNRLSTHKSNVASVLSTYEDILAVVDGNRPKDSVFEDVDSLLQKLQEVRSLVGAASR
eukprot:TRINITY_DN9029_c0_g1_i1.p1 TRINITY_DN9029_c0_g1~~TRINITY_DN9029_c0_g1_i1.p1  ORF type:complete len:321 (+),score=70.73 TRINITY_DN9029_c0_g1_i1:158-1120(+)